jgi:hypothetical protein
MVVGIFLVMCDSEFAAEWGNFKKTGNAVAFPNVAPHATALQKS